MDMFASLDAAGRYSARALLMPVSARIFASAC
jgi:hypothetical protein